MPPENFREYELVRSSRSYRRRVIVLVPSWGSTLEVFLRQARQNWSSNGYDVVQCDLPQHSLVNIEASSEAIRRFIDAVSPEYEDVVLVGHSMGGVLVRYCVQSNPDLPIAAAITFASPHKGTGLAKLAPWSASARKLVPGSELMRTLEEGSWPEDLPLLALQAQFDEITWPSDNCVYHDAINQKVPMTTHLSIIGSTRAFHEALGWLTYEVFGDPGVVDRTGYESKWTDNQTNTP